MEESNDIAYADLLGYLNDDIDSSKKESVESWIHDSPENEKEFQDVIGSWLVAGAIERSSLSDRFESNKAQAKNKVFDLIDRPSAMPEPEPAKVFSIAPMLRVAAVLAIVLGSAFWFYASNFTTENYTASAVKSEQFSLKEGSQITLNKMGEISFQDGFTKRKLKLTGEAFFDVKKADKPFIIYTHDATITVVGTSFNVKANAGQPTEVYVKSGIVELKYNQHQKPVVLKKEDLASLNSSDLQSANGAIVVEKQPDQNYLFWKNRNLVFDDMELNQVFEMLEQSYDVKILAGNKEILKCKITVDFKDTDVETILKVIAKTHLLNLSQENNVFKLSGQGC